MSGFATAPENGRFVAVLLGAIAHAHCDVASNI